MSRAPESTMRAVLSALVALIAACILAAVVFSAQVASCIPHAR